MQKIDIIKELRDLKTECSLLENVEKQNEKYRKQIKELEEKNNKLMKTEELKIYKKQNLRIFMILLLK
jgi:AMMECR1 domain-containing protein